MLPLISEVVAVSVSPKRADEGIKYCRRAFAPEGTAVPWCTAAAVDRTAATALSQMLAAGIPDC